MVLVICFCPEKKYTVGIIDILVLLKIENKGEIVINDIIFNLVEHSKVCIVIYSVGKLFANYLYTLEFIQKCQLCQLRVF